jgi:V-type H+-transporting ATPase subunit a
VLCYIISTKTPFQGAKHYKTVFIVCFHRKLLLTRINKICEGFRASLYSCPSSPTERKKLLESVCRRLDDIKLVINQTYSYRQNFLIQVANELRYWNTMVSKIKAIYHVLNFLNMDVTGKCFIAECWVPVRNIPMVKKALADGSVGIRRRSTNNEGVVCRGRLVVQFFHFSMSLRQTTNLRLSTGPINLRDAFKI